MINVIRSSCLWFWCFGQSVFVYKVKRLQKPVSMSNERVCLFSHCSLQLKEDDMIFAILNKLKAENRDLNPNYTQALCRVYTAICRQRRDWEKAHILAYSILAEGLHFVSLLKVLIRRFLTYCGYLRLSSLQPHARGCSFKAIALIAGQVLSFLWL